MGSTQERTRDPAPPEEGPGDGVLARKAQEGDRDAFERLVLRYLHPVHALVASFLRERAEVEDAAQETFLRALRSLDGFDPERPFAPWLYQIARNVARNRLARRRRDPSESLPDDRPEPADPGPSPAERMERERIRAMVEEAVEELPPQRRRVFRLVDIEGYTPTEAAGLLELTAGAVRAHLHHARRDLRARLEPELEKRGMRP